MLTQCPQCHTVFRLALALLEAAQGRVRCGRCNTIFDAAADLPDRPQMAPEPDDGLLETTPDVLLETPVEDPALPEFQLSEEELEDVFVEAPPSFVHPEAATTSTNSDEDTAENEILHLDIATAQAEEEITLEGEEISIVNEKTGEFRTNFAVETADETDAGLAQSDTPQNANPSDESPSRVHDDVVEAIGNTALSPADFAALTGRHRIRTAEGHRSKAYWVAGSVLLILLLTVQLVHFNRQSLVRNSAFGPSLAGLYAGLGIKLDPAWDLGAYQLHQWGAAADANGTLRIRASLINDSERAQPYPLLRLTLQDRFGERVGSRDLEPRDYLPSPSDPTSTTHISDRLLDAGQRIDADIAIVDPGKNTVGFELDVCLPVKNRVIACANDQAGHGS